MRRISLVLVGIGLVCMPAFGQQTGAISGAVTDANGSPLPGVLIEASGDVLPQSRVVTTNSGGEYRFQLLPPGNYTLTYSLDGLATVTREIPVLLQQTSFVDVTMQPEAVTEQVQVLASATLIDVTSAELKTAVDNETIDQLPVGQEYRDLVKLIPGVQYTEDGTRGPSAGGSGQDNVYQFDGVNVGLPLFGTLASEPSSHDIDQIAIVKGGAKAIDFNRSGGFTINSVSKSGTNAWHGQVSYQIQTEGMTGDRDTPSASEFDEDKDWAIVSIGGPVVRENLFIYGSYYRPTVDRGNRSNLYGEVPDFSNDRDELFGKLSWTPSQSFLLNASYRDSTREQRGESVTAEDRAGSTSEGSDVDQQITIAEANWIVNPNSFFNFKYTDFQYDTLGRPDNILGFGIAIDGSVPLNVGALETQGLFEVPQPIAGEDEYNAFIQPIIDRYGYVEGGQRVGGGRVGAGSTFNQSDYPREAWEIDYDYLLGTNVTHELHFGYQNSKDEEILSRTSNGWGFITVDGGRFTTDDGEPYFYTARFQQQSLFESEGAVVAPITSGFESQSFEINDTIKTGNWSFNVGFLVSNDELFGQGLRPNSANSSGFELAPGNRYKMYEVDWDEMISPRLGAIWAYNGSDTAYVNFARYYPAASSLPRAASWARNLRSEIEARFDADGNLLAAQAIRSSSGKFFQDGIDPRSIDEYLIGTSKQFNRRWTGRAHARYREGQNFWEDTNNNARLRYDPPPGIPQTLYIPQLDEWRDEVGGSSYVIAELDGAFTKYYEVNLEGEYRSTKAFGKVSYVWSHYYGNFDQDNTTTENDDNIFIGSSFIADGAGRQLWNFREGNLRGDRRHQVKAYGYYNFDWDGSAGVYAIYQSGQPWEAWNVEIYRQYTSSTSDTSRYAEPAGSRTTSSHWQVDLNYTQNFRIGDRFNIQVRADLFNVFDEQTGYNIQNKVNSANFGDPRDFFNPRRLQLAAKFQF